jgi:hypothetical protein
VTEVANIQAGFVTSASLYYISQKKKFIDKASRECYSYARTTRAQVLPGHARIRPPTPDDLTDEAERSNPNDAKLIDLTRV